MPISGSPKEIIHEEMSRFKHGTLHSGPDKYGHLAKSRKQAIAIALSEARQHRDAGGAAGRSTAVQDIINALQQGSAAYGGPSNAQNPMGNATPSAPAPANAPNPLSQMPAPTTGLATGSTTPAATTTAGLQSPVTNSGLGSVIGGPQMILRPGLGGSAQGLAFGGTPTPPWYVRRENAEELHAGPVMSAVPGRTDRHNVSIGSSGYVVPADVVSHLGQSNSISGMKVLSNMFNMGPYGASVPHMGHGMGLPRPPRPMGISDAGGARGTKSNIGQPTPVVIAGGEFTVPPEKLIERFRTNDMKHIHEVMDKWMLRVRRDHIKTLKGLPPPVKS